jgi:hypothetical protein
MTQVQDNQWKKFFDVAKIVLGSGLIGIGFKLILLGYSIVIAFTTMSNKVTELTEGQKDLIKKSEISVQDRRDLQNQINTINRQLIEINNND